MKIFTEIAKKLLKRLEMPESAFESFTAIKNNFKSQNRRYEHYRKNYRQRLTFRQIYNSRGRQSE
ncbi:MAG: hypothetical protein IJT73_05785 [Selenomonadaceae bacterium]|nr:hypothetical protein [Selenomonadaceae bacterium]